MGGAAKGGARDAAPVHAAHTPPREWARSLGNNRKATRALTWGLSLVMAFILTAAPRGWGGTASDGQQTISAAHAGGPDGSQSMPPSLRSTVQCDPPVNGTTPNVPTPKEHDLQQQRRCILTAAGDRPAGGYVSMCLVVKNQHRELPEWLDWYRRLGVSQIYVMEDEGSVPPLDEVLQPFVQDGFVTHRKLPPSEEALRELNETTCRVHHPRKQQLHAYAYCMRDYGARHRWMGFFDADEFLVLTDGTQDLPALLRDYENAGAVAFNWQMFGSSGRLTYPEEHTLLAYTKCSPPENGHNKHVKVIANMAYSLFQGVHDAQHARGYNTVMPSRKIVRGCCISAPVDYSRAILNHYVLGSREQFKAKVHRGSAMEDGGKSWGFWDAIEKTMTQNCTTGIEAWERVYAGGAAGEEQQEAAAAGTEAGAGAAQQKQVPK